MEEVESVISDMSILIALSSGATTFIACLEETFPLSNAELNKSSFNSLDFISGYTFFSLMLTSVYL